MKAHNRAWRERLPGGTAAGMHPDEFDPVELARGTSVELEHTPNRDLATEIAMDHLAEDPLYYRKLALIDPHHNPRPRNGSCVIILRAGRVLAISNDHDTRDWNLVGGRVEPGESFAAAAVRECMEETQVDLRRATLIPIRRRRTYSGGEAVAFMVVGDVRFPPAMYSDPFEGHVAWKYPTELLAPGCTHADANLVTFGRVGLV